MPVGYLLPSVPLCTAPLAGSERPRPAGYERKVSGPVDPRAAAAARRRSSALRSSRDWRARARRSIGAPSAVGRAPQGRGTTVECVVVRFLLCCVVTAPFRGQGTVDETEHLAFLPFETRACRERPHSGQFYPLRGSAPPQEPGTWSLAGTCTLVNTPHVTT